MRTFALADLPNEPWRNGGGTLRTIASGGGACASDWDWRVSCADIVQTSAYSIFPGIDRQQMLIEGRLLNLHGFDTPLQLERVGDSLAFPGEAPLSASLGAGPVRVWNVLVRRYAAACMLRMSRDEIVHLAPRNNGVVRVLLVMEGAYRLRRPGVAAIDLSEGVVVCEDGALGPWTLQPAAPLSTLLVTELSYRLS